MVTKENGTAPRYNHNYMSWISENITGRQKKQKVLSKCKFDEPNFVSPILPMGYFIRTITVLPNVLVIA